MYEENEAKRQQAALRRRMVLVQVLGFPGVVLVGLAVYALWGANGNAFHPLLNDEDVAWTMLVVGGLIMLWETVYMLVLLKRHAERRAGSTTKDDNVVQ